MIIAQQQNDIVKSGLDNSKKATINQDKLAKLQYLLTKGLYSDPESAIIVEWTNNAVDAIVQAGKNPVENPVIVTVTNQIFSVKDCGTGLNKEEFETVCMSYLSSTKEESNEQIGAFGIGMKSFMSLDRAATFTCIKNRYMWKFLAYQGSEFMEYDLIFEGDTTEENGVECSIALNGWSESIKFKDKAKARLAYYDTVVLNIDNQIINNNIIRGEKWQFSSQNQEDILHLCLKDVFYHINYDKLGIKPINMPIALRFNLNEGLQPTPSRESLIWNTHTINLVKNRIEEVSNYFVQKHNEQMPDEYELLEIFENIDDTEKFVTLADQRFQINELLKYATVQPKELKIKGIELKTPDYYWNLRTKLLEEYETLIKYENYKWSVKYVRNSHGWNRLLNNVKHIEVDKTPSGLVKKYLLEKHKSRNILFIKKVSNRRLGSVNDKRIDSVNYRNLLTLSMELDPITSKTDKSKFRPLIKEWQFVENQFKSLIINEKNVETSKEYLEWLTKYKEHQKANRLTYGSSGNHKVLNKQKGEATLGIVVAKEVGSGYKIDKQTFKIEEFHKIPRITICFTEDQKERAKDFYELLKGRFKVCTAGKNEFNKLKDKHNFMTEEQFKHSKAFKRMMTSIRYNDLVEEFNKLFDRKEIEVIQDLVKPLYKDIQTLKDYVNKNNKRVNSEILDELLAVAEEHNLYDFEFFDVYNRVKQEMKKYEFINLIQKPNHWNEEAKAKVKTLIGQVLYHQKMYHNLHESIEIELKPKEIPVKVEEEELELA